MRVSDAARIVSLFFFQIRQCGARGCGLGFTDELGCLRWIYHPGIESPPPILNPLYIEYEFPLWYIIMCWNMDYKGSVARP